MPQHIARRIAVRHFALLRAENLRELFAYQRAMPVELPSMAL